MKLRCSSGGQSGSACKSFKAQPVAQDPHLPAEADFFFRKGKAKYIL